MPNGVAPHPIPLPKRGEGDRLPPSRRKVSMPRAFHLDHLAPWGEVGRRPGEGARAVVFSEESHQWGSFSEALVDALP